jgi:UDP-N-acetylglucosamine diphosphorylase/glucosamine-1-phosphate N-acetyltransferase|tara:strand:+ start:13985 stop:15112 length:1128 start_codon:yes stop_codon:yes gene_type:complete
MKIQLHDNGLHLEFAPLSLLKPIAELRMGILTFEERWEEHFPDATFSFATEDYLQKKYPMSNDWDLSVPANVIPSEDYAAVLNSMDNNTSLYQDEIWLGTKGNGSTKMQYKGEEIIVISKRWHLFQKNDVAIKSDFSLLTDGMESQKLSDTVTIIGDRNLVFLEEGAKAEACVLNTTDGPIYIGENAEIMEGSLVRGPFALCDNAGLKMGAKIYGATTVGPHCKVGGEVGNSVFQAYSNKGHDGYVGNSLIGEWCNLGADTNTSNLKNNYSTIRTYNYTFGKEEQTDLQFMGLTMGDHSKCGINTMFNTATVVGVSCNIYGGDFPQKFIPSFSWGGEEFVPFEFDKALEAANGMMKRRGLELSEVEIEILNKIKV